MRKFSRRKTTMRLGAAMVEFAVVLPVFTAILLGIVEFGRAFTAYETVVTASREGCRKAVQGSVVSNTPVETAVNDALTFGSVPTGSVVTAVTVTGSGSSLANAKRGDTVEVRVTVPYGSISFLTPKFMEGASLVSRTTMRREDPIF